MNAFIKIFIILLLFFTTFISNLFIVFVEKIPNINPIIIINKTLIAVLLRYFLIKKSSLLYYFCDDVVAYIK